MKYYEKIPENFLLIRFVATRFCNYRCPYCYVPLEKRNVKKTMFSHHNRDEWIQALKDNFSDRNIEFYFTGGEPLVIEDCVLLINELAKWKNVSSIRIDTNLSKIENFLKFADSRKIGFLTAFHPTQITYEKYKEKIMKAQEKEMVGIVNFVASKENINLLGISPHELIKKFEEMNIFLNLAKDFYSGFSKGWNWEYEQHYKRYIDMLQYSLDNDYMNKFPINKGFLCGGGGRHYITINRHGQVFSCGNKMARTTGYGNIFDKTLNLPNSLQICQENCCPSIISYSFSCSNDFLPVDHTKDYVKRCNKIREGISDTYLDTLWGKIVMDNIFIKKKKSYFLGKLKTVKRILFTPNKKATE